MKTPARTSDALDLRRLQGREALYAHGRYSPTRIAPKRTLPWYLDADYLLEIVRLSRVQDGQRVLDVNTGNPMSGTTAIWLKRAAPGIQLVAIDRSEQLVADAAEN